MARSRGRVKPDAPKTFGGGSHLPGADRLPDLVVDGSSQITGTIGLAQSAAEGRHHLAHRHSVAGPWDELDGLTRFDHPSLQDPGIGAGARSLGVALDDFRVCQNQTGEPVLRNGAGNGRGDAPAPAQGGED